jgi:hypothetical protein
METVGEAFLHSPRNHGSFRTETGLRGYVDAADDGLSGDGLPSVALSASRLARRVVDRAPTSARQATSPARRTSLLATVAAGVRARYSTD